MPGVLRSHRATSQQRYSLANQSTQDFLKAPLHAETKDRFPVVQKTCVAQVAAGFFPFGQMSFSLTGGARG